MSDHPSVTSLIVTYGSRQHLISQVIERLILGDIRNIVIVANGVSAEYEKFLKMLMEIDARVKICWNRENLGSAGGIGTGLKWILHNLATDYIWFLDDDNVPESNSLSVLIKATSDYDMNFIALHSYRRTGYENSDPKSWIVPERSSFFEFDISTAIKRVAKRLSLNTSKVKTESVIELPYCPYGGLFLSLTLAQRIGLPNHEFFLYADDTEYTFRISRNGGKIILLNDSIIDDVDGYWGLKYPSPKLFTQFLLEEPFFRGYYSIRNHSFFDKNIWMESSGLYIVNRSAFLIILFLLSVRYFRVSRFLEIVRAVREGENNKLGKRYEK